MARKTLTVVIEDEGRDQGKKFFIREMPASQGEYWAQRLINGAVKGGVNLPDNIGDLGMAGIASIALTALLGMPMEIAKPLLDEMWEQVSVVSESGTVQGVGEPKTRLPLEEDIEEILTRHFLRTKVFGLHFDFSKAVAKWITGLDQAAAEKTSG